MFASDESGDYNIYSLDLESRTITPITDAADKEWDPDLSADGSRVAWAGEEGINISDADGTNAFLLTHHGPEDLNPSWSPDGSTIAFSSRRNGVWEVYLRAAQSGASDLDRLTRNTVPDYEPAWSPTRREIVFTRGTGAAEEIIRLNLTNRRERRLTDDDVSDRDPTWSPDGGEIAFARKVDGSYEIFIMDRSGAEQRQVTNDAGDYHDPVWSPDGRFLAFQGSAGDDTTDLFIVELATGSREQLIEPGNAAWPSWR